MAVSSIGATAARTANLAVLPILLAVSACHLLNDMMQSLLPAIYPMLKANFALSFGQIGLITLTFQLTASLLQPLVGLYTDKRPKPYLAAGRHGLHACSACCCCRCADSFRSMLLAAALVGIGSSVFHPESSRVARMASGGRTASRSRCSRSAATPARRSGRCWRR